MPKSSDKAKPMQQPAETIQGRFERILEFHSATDGVPEYRMPINDLDINGVMDSLDVVEVVIECEKEFGIEITDEELCDLRSIGQLWRIVQREIARLPVAAQSSV